IGKMGIDPIEKSAKAYFFVYKEGKPVDPVKAPRG
ncbi:MAG: M23 family peptidase, partial [Spirochaetes bacterium]